MLTKGCLKEIEVEDYSFKKKYIKQKTHLFISTNSYLCINLNSLLCKPGDFVFIMIYNYVTSKCNKHILLLLEKITKIRLRQLPFMSIIIKLEKKKNLNVTWAHEMMENGHS